MDYCDFAKTKETSIPELLSLPSVFLAICVFSCSRIIDSITLFLLC